MTVDAATLLSLTGPAADLTPHVAGELARRGRGESYPAAAIVLEAGEPAERFHLVTSGRLHLGLAGDSRPPLVIQSLGEGDLVGLSWYYAPYRWQWDVTAALPTTTVSFSAAEIRELCAADREVELGMLRMLTSELHDRLSHTRLQLLDLYATPGWAP